MRKLAKLILITLLASVAIAILFAFLNFLPRNVTESVTVITTDQSGCVVQTYDKFILKIKSCNARPGETITVTYDEKMKERFRSTTP